MSSSKRRAGDARTKARTSATSHHQTASSSKRGARGARTIVRQVEALGYWVSLEPFQGRRDIILNGGFTSQRVGAHVLLNYQHPFNPRRNEEEIAMTHLQQIHIDSVDVEVTEDLLDIDPFAAPHTSHRHTPYPIFEDPSSEFYGLTAIQYQGEIILWLQREYGLHVKVEYTPYEDFLVAQNQHQDIYPKYMARLSDLLQLNRVKKVLCIMTRVTYLKIQNLNTVASLIFVGQ